MEQFTKQKKEYCVETETREELFNKLKEAVSGRKSRATISKNTFNEYNNEEVVMLIKFEDEGEVSIKFFYSVFLGKNISPSTSFDAGPEAKYSFKTGPDGGFHTEGSLDKEEFAKKIEDMVNSIVNEHNLSIE